MNGFYEAVKRQLELNGYRYARAGKGSHEIWTNDKRNQALSRNMPSRFMANEIMKQAGIAHRF